jgi:hypothetical protein
MLLLIVAAAPALAQPAPGPHLIAPPAGQTSSFTLVNRTPAPIRELFVTSAGNANWGQNRLDGRNGNPTAIAAGSSFVVRRRADTTCIFDIRVVFADGRPEDRRGVNTCAVEEVIIGAASAPAAMNPGTGKAADDPSFKLFNRSPRPIVEFYVTLTGASNPPAWGVNQLADSPLVPDSSRLVTLPRDGNCIYDLRVVYADHKAQERKRFNLCKVSELPVP